MNPSTFYEIGYEAYEAFAACLPHCPPTTIPDDITDFLDGYEAACENYQFERLEWNSDFLDSAY